MADQFNRPKTESSTNEWLTPPHIIKALGEFDLDPCAPRKEIRPWDTAKKHFTGPTDLFDQQVNPERVCGLTQPWAGRVWLNPPYGDETFKWVGKLAHHKSGVAMIFARTETQGFHEQIWRKAHGVFFFQGRVSFYRIDGTQGDNGGAPSCLISYSIDDSYKIETSCLEGHFVRLR